MAGVTLGRPVSAASWQSPRTLFGLVVVAAFLCVLGAAAVVVVGFRDRTAEIAILVGALLVLSTLAFAHGLTVPHALYGENAAFTTTALLGLPAALVCATPLLAPQSGWARRIAGNYNTWVLGWSAAAAALSAALLAVPDAIVLPGPRHPLVIAVALTSLAALLALSFRQLRLYWIGEAVGTLVAALGLTLIGITALAWLAEPYGLGFWQGGLSPLV